MTKQDAFGGPWTQDKLERLKRYLEAYVKVFKNQDWAKTVYVDAFAGTGSIPPKKTKPRDTAQLEIIDPEVQDFLAGSAKVALGIEPAFGQYLFIENSKKKIEELDNLKQEFPHRAERIEVVNADANEYLMEWARKVTGTTRAVVFLDPCGMQVEWRLLEALAGTKVVDLWLLVPIGMGVNRLLTQGELPPQEWQDRLTTFFGTEEWLEEFYKPVVAENLFGLETDDIQKVANYEALAAYFVKRLKTIFPEVAPNPLTQRNSKSSPMFMLCFAAQHPKALEIATYILSMKLKRR